MKERDSKMTDTPMMTREDFDRIPTLAKEITEILMPHNPSDGLVISSLTEVLALMCHLYPEEILDITVSNLKTRCAELRAMHSPSGEETVQ